LGDVLSNGLDYFNQDKYLVIGDVHGKLSNFKELLERYKLPSIQLGDFGFHPEHTWFLENMDVNSHRICFGNHDHTGYLKMPHSLGNWSWFPKLGIMTIRGAKSIDQYRRTEGLDWFRDEELTYSEMQEVIDKAAELKPRVIIGHDCPKYISNMLWGHEDKSITSNGFNVLHTIHQPELWLFGHHHKSIELTIKNTKFKCLAELETYILTDEDYN